MKKLVSLFLVLSLLLGMAHLALAEDVKKITISVINGTDEYYPKDDEELPGDLNELFEAIKHMLPGYEITVDVRKYEDYQAQLPLLLAANDIPDIFISNVTSFMEYYPTGLFIEDLTELVDQYGPYLRENLMQRSFDICTINGKLAAIPCENFYYKFPTILRMDWVEKLGFEVKEVYTLSEISEILLAMTEKDPDGNGKNDTYGLGTRFNGGDWTQTFMPIFGAFGGQPNQNYLVGNEVVPFNVSDNFRSAMEYLHDLYAAKAIDQECFVLNYDQALINAAKGTGGLYSGWWNVGRALLHAGLLELQPEVDYKTVFITSDDGLTHGVRDNGTIWKTAMISADCEYPEAAMALINLMNTEFGKYSGNTLLRDENGDVMYSSDVHSEQTRMYKYPEWNTYNSDDEAYAAGCRHSPLGNLFANMVLRNASQILSLSEDYDQNDKALALSRMGEILEMNEENRPVYTDFFYGYLATDEYLEYFAALETLMKEWVVDFVTGNKEINDANWQAYLDSYVAKGGQKVLESMLDQYNTLNGTAYTAVNVNGK